MLLQVTRQRRLSRHRDSFKTWLLFYIFAQGEPEGAGLLSDNGFTDR